MKKIYSKHSNDLLHIVFTRNDMLEVKDRFDISPELQFLQCSALKVHEGKTYRPHYHIWKEPQFDKIIAQESWVVISGEVIVSYYDTDNELIEKVVLNPGDISITYKGGHSYEILSDDTLVYEYKIGPYSGQSNDKKFIE